jgi:hypothetical protein
MSFNDFVAGNTPGQPGAAAPAGTFQHSQQTLPAFDKPTDAQNAENATKVKAIAGEIAQKFDAEYQGLSQQLMGGQIQLNQIFQMGMAPPLALFQAVAYQLVHLSNVCKSYQADADALAKAGAGEFKNYLKMFVDDAAAALAQVQNTPTAFMYGPPLDPTTFFAGMNHGPTAPPIPPQSWPGMGSPFKAGGPPPPVNPGPMPSADLSIFNTANKAIQDAASRISSKWDEYIRS